MNPTIPQAGKPMRPTLWPVLGVTRFVLALIVASTHLYNFNVGGTAALLGTFGSMSAVLAFLVISGYSIAHSIERERTGFYGRRVDRIYPTYLFAVIYGVIPFLIAGPVVGSLEAPRTIWPFIANALMLQGFLSPSLATIGTNWTLSIECALYLLAPIFLRLSAKAIFALIACSAAAYSFLNQGGTVMHVPYGGIGVGMLAWAWLTGWCLYRYPGAASRLLLIVGAAAIALCPVDHQYLGETTWAIFAIIMVCLPDMPTLPNQLARLFKWLGDLSYPLYLLHFPTYALLSALHVRLNGWAMIGLSIAAAAICLHAVDLPYRAYAKRRRTANLLDRAPSAA